MIEWKLGTVLRAVEPSGSTKMQELKVELEDGAWADAVHDTEIHSPVWPGERVLLNTTAVMLRLGTGGLHFVHAILPRMESAAALYDDLKGDNGESSSDGQTGHIMKLRYTSLQRAVLAAEEPASPHHELFRSGPRTLNGMPVLVGELHSMLPAAVCFLRQIGRDSGISLRIAYIMSDGGALPLAVSRHAVTLGRLGWLAGTVTFGHAYGGEIEAVNKYTALLAAKHVLKADIAIAVMGPGSVGTATPMGFSGIEVGEILNAVSALKGYPVVMPRISFADPRDRHFGISHHTLTVLTSIVQNRLTVALPGLVGKEEHRLTDQIERSGLAEHHEIRWMTVGSKEWQLKALQSYTLPVTSMGRGIDADPAFFAGIEASARLACKDWNIIGAQ